MVKYANKYEYDNFKDFELKLITPLAALEFAKAQNESIQQLSNYFNQDYFSKPRSFIEIFDSLMVSIRSREVELYGLYNGRRLLGVGVYQYISYSDNGCEVVIWMRASEEGKKIGEYLLKKLTLYAFFEKNFRFVELLIDESNLASRKIASNIGYEHIETFAGNTSGRLGSGKYCRYLCFDEEIDAIAEAYDKRKVDLIDHPAHDKYFRNLILNEEVNEAFKWPYPILEQRSTRIEASIPKPRRPRKKPYRIPIFSNSPIPKYKYE
jgi:RimJ/RimL family protein N-acetyltransferase